MRRHEKRVARISSHRAQNHHPRHSYSRGRTPCSGSASVVPYRGGRLTAAACIEGGRRIQSTPVSRHFNSYAGRSTMYRMQLALSCVWCYLILLSATDAIGQMAAPAKLLFLGDNGPHRPAERFAQLKPALAA